MAKVGIIGGGIAGSSVALYLSSRGIDVTLFEQQDSLISGPPMCHLHAGGNLYPDISNEQCITLLEQSIEFVRTYKEAIDFRPTVIALPKHDKQEAHTQLHKLQMLQAHYEKLVQKDANNKVLGEVADYYKLYTKEELTLLKTKTSTKNPQSFNEWMIPVAKHLDFNQIKFPLIMVQEYGINVFRLSALLTHSLQRQVNCNLWLESDVIDITKTEKSYDITYKQAGKTKEHSFDFLINAAGFRTGFVDNMLGFKRERFVEFKSAYVSQWSSKEQFPEIIFHGQRGTPRGMAQFTPYPNGFVQLHGMTDDITLFHDGLVKSTATNAQPQLDKRFCEKIKQGWSTTLVKERTEKAISHVAQYMPTFTTATTASQPLFGGQQIPGVDKTLRAANVTFEGDTYARCEIVKASSVLTMSRLIEAKLENLGFLTQNKKPIAITTVNEKTLSDTATALALQRDYPKSLGLRYYSNIS